MEEIGEYAFITLRGLVLLGGQVKIDRNLLFAASGEGLGVGAAGSSSGGGLGIGGSDFIRGGGKSRKHSY